MHTYQCKIILDITLTSFSSLYLSLIFLSFFKDILVKISYAPQSLPFLNRLLCRFCPELNSTFICYDNTGHRLKCGGEEIFPLCLCKKTLVLKPSPKQHNFLFMYRMQFFLVWGVGGTLHLSLKLINCQCWHCFLYRFKSFFCRFTLNHLVYSLYPLLRLLGICKYTTTFSLVPFPIATVPCIKINADKIKSSLSLFLSLNFKLLSKHIITVVVFHIHSCKYSWHDYQILAHFTRNFSVQQKWNHNI